MSVIKLIILTDTGQENISASISMCEDGEIRHRLDGESFDQSKGRVELCYDGVWRTVCADEVASNIICSQVGYSLRNYSGLS